MRVLGLSILLASSLSWAQTSNIDTVANNKCQPLQEFKSTREFLQKFKIIDLSETQEIRWSLEVTKGCQGASQRFQRVFSVLEKSGLDIKKTFDLSVKFAELTDSQTDTFITAFKGLFLENKYDFTFYEAFEISQQFAFAPADQQPRIKSDFEKILEFCLDQNAADLPLPTCREYSMRLMKISAQFGSQALYPEFSKIIQFLSTKSGLQYPVLKNLDLAAQILEQGPYAADSFIEAYAFSQSKSGLQLNTSQSFKFALEISKNSQRKNEK